MTSTATPIDYPAGDGQTVCKGVYYTPDTAGTALLPVVLICHAWDGLLQEVHDKAQKLAAHGFIAFAIDVYGNGKTETDFSQLEATLTPYMADRGLLLSRMQAAVAAAKTLPGADTARMGAMGYCFGGTAVLDLARAGGTDIKGVASFHGGLQGNDLEVNGPVNASVLVLHGEDDPLVPPQQVQAFKAEMNSRAADWQLVAYSNTMHAFTRPEANNPDFGAVYNARTDRRSWRAMLDFFNEVI
ncbi:MAG: dienelactone hydrolase family protein [Gammaproteobacteria bacterium]|nr:dienelactone hydrolase family protein [Gammaproteobacteria bacterium]